MPLSPANRWSWKEVNLKKDRYEGLKSIGISEQAREKPFAFFRKIYLSENLYFLYEAPFFRLRMVHRNDEEEKNPSGFFEDPSPVGGWGALGYTDSDLPEIVRYLVQVIRHYRKRGA